MINRTLSNTAHKSALVFICTVVFFFLTRRPDWLNIKILTYGPKGDRLGLDIADIEALLTRAGTGNVAAFNQQEKVLGAFSVMVIFQTSRRYVSSSTAKTH